MKRTQYQYSHSTNILSRDQKQYLLLPFSKSLNRRNQRTMFALVCVCKHVNSSWKAFVEYVAKNFLCFNIHYTHIQVSMRSHTPKVNYILYFAMYDMKIRCAPPESWNEQKWRSGNKQTMVTSFGKIHAHDGISFHQYSCDT